MSLYDPDSDQYAAELEEWARNEQEGDRIKAAHRAEEEARRIQPIMDRFAELKKRLDELSEQVQELLDVAREDSPDPFEKPVPCGRCGHGWTRNREHVFRDGVKQSGTPRTTKGVIWYHNCGGLFRHIHADGSRT